MRIEGNLAKWNDDRGFGFIAPAQGGAEIFVHISAFPKDGQRPTIGERLTFEIEIDRNGKNRAKNLRCPARPSIRPMCQSVSSGRGFLGYAIPVVAVIALAFYGYSRYSARIAYQSSNRIDPQTAAATPASDLSASSSFRCDGRTHCSQMTSCAEATYFLRNCPNVKMDGNNDGVPCERQWCN